MGNILEEFFLPYQLKYIRDKSRFKVLEKSRRIGGTYCQSYEDVEDIVTGYCYNLGTEDNYIKGPPVEKVYFSSKDEEAGKEYIEYCAKWAKWFNVIAHDLGEEILDDKKGIKARSLEIIVNGKTRKIMALTSSPTCFASKGGKVVWDEAALHKDQKQMWKGAKPAAMWGYPIRILSTHRGKKSLLWKFVCDIVSGKLDWGHHKVTIVDAVNDGLLDKIYSRKTTQEERDRWLAAEKVDCGDNDIWEEEYMCNPQDSTTAYIPYELYDSCVKDGYMINKLELKNLKGPLFSGWDIARVNDLSEVVALEKIGIQYAIRNRQSMKDVKFSIQKKIASFYLNLKKMLRMCIDKTGMGIPIVEDMQDEHGSRAEGVTFTNSVKEDMAVKLKNALEDRVFILPDNEDFRESFHSIQRIVTSAGNIRFDADRTEKTGHADLFWATALAYHAATDSSTGEVWADSKDANDAWSGATDPYSGFDGYNSSMINKNY